MSRIAIMRATDQMTGSFPNVLQKRASIADETVNALEKQQRHVPLEDEVNFGYYVRYSSFRWFSGSRQRSSRKHPSAMNLSRKFGPRESSGAPARNASLVASYSFEFSK
jgi:hypothetical protein